MSADDLYRPAIDALSGRVALVGYVSTLFGAGFLLVLIWAGAPAEQLSFAAAWHQVDEMGVGRLLLIGIAATVVTVVAHPFQLALVRVLEGRWPNWLGAGRLRRRQQGRRRRLAERAALDPSSPPAGAELARRGQAAARLRRLFPGAASVQPTALGNALAAFEETAGSAYGWDAVVAWPRLYLCLSDRAQAVVDDRRDALDLAVRLSVVGWLVALAAACLLCRSQWWLLLVAVPVAVGIAGYRGAVRAAIAYGEAVTVAFDLYRFDLLAAVHVSLPADTQREKDVAAALSVFWRQGGELFVAYRHPPGESV